jgi:hypothetical protein
MKKLMTVVLAGAMTIPAMAFAQSAQQDDAKASQDHANQSAEVAQMGSSTLPQHTMAGMVSNHGKTFTSDNKEYIVNNPGSLKSYDNQSVSVKYQFNADNNKIHIVSVSPGQ